MLEKLYKAIKKDATPVELKIAGRTYVDKNIFPVANPTPEPILTSTLTGLVDYVSKQIDGVDRKQLFIQVRSPSIVRLVSEILPDFWNRAEYLEARYNFGLMNFDSWYDSETFMINLLAQFADKGDKAKFLAFLAKVTDTAESVYDDSGISQGVTTRRSIASKSAELLPNPVMLAPFRTFPEIEQPESPFILRVQKDHDGLSYLLSEADGGAWRNTAIQSIKKYLQEKLPDMAIIA